MLVCIYNRECKDKNNKFTGLLDIVKEEVSDTERAGRMVGWQAAKIEVARLESELDACGTSEDLVIVKVDLKRAKLALSQVTNGGD